jgi:hypothetical protein
MPSVGRVTLLCLVLALGMILGVATDAGAKTKRKIHPRSASSAVGLESVEPDAANGRVSSDERACRAGRQVTLYRVNSGASVASGEFVATTYTRGDGSWTVPGPLFPSEFYAIAERKTARGVVCEPATSNSLRWG